MTRRIRATTIRTYDQAGVSKATSRAATKPPTRRVLQEDVTKPDRLVRLLNDMQEDIDQADAGVWSNPNAAPSIHRNLVLQAGQSVTVRHDLERPWTGWKLTRLYAGSLNTISEDPAGLPMGLTTTQAIQLKNVGGAQVQFDVEITGD